MYSTKFVNLVTKKRSNKTALRQIKWIFLWLIEVLIKIVDNKVKILFSQKMF